MTPNGLIQEKSPYLRQHAHNPVNWQPWSDAAFDRARAENKPVFLSIGYATCHWCHVMEKESFEDLEAAGHLNNTFVCVKVDREERPDIDAVYMAACQLLTGSGGWPLSIFMSPDKRPFYAATYLPKTSRFGAPGIIDLCRQVHRWWTEQRHQVDTAAAEVLRHLDTAFVYTPAAETEAFSEDAVLDRALQDLIQNYDAEWGGFEPAPKFPTPHRLRFLLRMHHRGAAPGALDMATHTLTAMRLGGIWDHVGHGFHRYATDSRWLVPHFEKMLYDQALMATVYMEAYQITQDPLMGRTAREIFDYVLGEMTAPEGGFYSAQDADSEGEEGKFYVWAHAAFREAVTAQDDVPWDRIFNIRPDGNYHAERGGTRTDKNIPHLTTPLSGWADALGMTPETLDHRWASTRLSLLRRRSQRPPPLRDHKILTDWNGMMIAALANGARVFQEPAYAMAARKAAAFVLTHLRDETGALYHRFCDGHRAVPAQATDYAWMVQGLLWLYQATYDLSYAETAVSLQEALLENYWDDIDGGMFSVPDKNTDLPVRPKELHDGAVPSANSVSLENMLLLGSLTGNPLWNDRAHRLVRAFGGTVSSHPAAFTSFLCGLDLAQGKGEAVIITGAAETPQLQRLVSELGRVYAPHRVAQIKTPANAGRLARFAAHTRQLETDTNAPKVHLCRGGACTGTADGPDALMP